MFAVTQQGKSDYLLRLSSPIILGFDDNFCSYILTIMLAYQNVYSTKTHLLEPQTPSLIYFNWEKQHWPCDQMNQIYSTATIFKKIKKLMSFAPGGAGSIAKFCQKMRQWMYIKR